MLISEKEVKKIIERIDMLIKDIDVVTLNIKKEELETEMKHEKFWENVGKAQRVQKEFSDIQKELALKNELENWKQDLLEYYNIYSGTNLSIDEKKNITLEIDIIIKKIEKLSIRKYLCGKFDTKESIITIKSGQGGCEAQDWVSMLYRMYTKYIARKDWKIEILDEQKGAEAGYTSVVFKVSGEYTYGYLKKETGVHRLVRISPFNAQGLRQTSFASVEVMPSLVGKDLKDIEVKSEDIEMKTMLSGGPGGQHVNKTLSAVQLTHKPSGITVRCSAQRNQHQNREQAMNILKSKLLAKEEEKELREEKKLKKDVKKAQWGNQIRNYILHPYKLVKDVRTGVETSNVDAVLDGSLDLFIEAEVVL